jgi:NAD(P)-dependent dehydrogenase (short-subunit alcohol dehydrogenase family)
MIADTADRTLARFRGRIRLSGLEDLFPHLNLRSKRGSGYRKQLAQMRQAILVQIDGLAITALVNNAGLGSAGKLLDSNIDDLESMIYLNVTALTRLALVPLPPCAWRSRNSSRRSARTG